MGLFATKPVERIIADSEGGARPLRKTLGAGGLLSLGIGAVFVTRVFTETQFAASQNAGPGVVVSIAVAALAALFAGLCYSEFAGMIPVAGGAYSYTYAAFGEWPAWVIGWNLLLAYGVASASASIGWSGHVITLLRTFGIDVPSKWAAGPFEALPLPDGRTVHGHANLPAVLIVVLAPLAAMIGMEGFRRIVSVTVAIKMGALLVFIGMCWPFIDTANYKPFIPPNAGEFGHFGLTGILAGAAPLLLAYLSFDAVSTAAQECKNPRRDMPVGILGTLAVCAVVYVLFGLALTGIVNYKTLIVTMSVAQAVQHTPYAWIDTLTRLGTVMGYTSVILVLLMAQSRLFYSMSRDGLISPAFSEVHPKFQIPWRFNIVFLLAAAPLAAFLPSWALNHVTTAAALLAFAAVCAGVWVMRVRRPGLDRPFKTPLVPLIPILGIVCYVAMIGWLGWRNWVRLLLWLAVGQPIYFAYRRYRSRSKGGGAAESSQVR